jgi:hypothetical protein
MDFPDLRETVCLADFPAVAVSVGPVLTFHERRVDLVAYRGQRGDHDQLPHAEARHIHTDLDLTSRNRKPSLPLHKSPPNASARNLLQTAGADAKTWLSEPVVTEWLLDGILVGTDGTADPDLRVQFHVRAFAGCNAVRVAVVVENCLDTWAGNIGYDMAVALGKNGRLVYEKKDVDHRRLSRWRKDFWWPAAPAQADVVHDLAYLSASGAVPNYDRPITIPPRTLDAMAADWAKSTETDIMGSGSLTKYMPTTGGRPEIGPYPNWTVQYLLSMDPRAKQIVLGNGDLAGSWPIHLRTTKTHRILTLDERPKFWLTGYRADDKERPLWQPDRKTPPPQRMADGKEHPYYLSPDVAHMGSFAYVPYLVTGDFYYLEEKIHLGFPRNAAADDPPAVVVTDAPKAEAVESLRTLFCDRVRIVDVSKRLPDDATVGRHGVVCHERSPNYRSGPESPPCDATTIWI